MYGVRHVRYWYVTVTKNLQIPLRDTQNPPLEPVNHPSEEGLQDDMTNTTNNSHTIPDYMMHLNHKSQHHRPDLVRAVNYTLDSEGKLKRDPTYRGRRKMQIIECKYSTDGNIPTIIHHIFQTHDITRDGKKNPHHDQQNRHFSH